MLASVCCGDQGEPFFLYSKMFVEPSLLGVMIGISVDDVTQIDDGCLVTLCFAALMHEA